LCYHPQCVGMLPLHFPSENVIFPSWICPAHSCKKCASTNNIFHCIGCGYGFCSEHKVQSNSTASVCFCEECLTRLTTSEEVFAYFVEALQRGLNTPIEKIPFLGKKPLDLLHIFKSTIKNGGGIRVTALKLWKKIGRELDLPLTITNASSMLRKHYIRLLLPIEQLTTRFQKST
jgi:hypothetical protein